MIENYGEVGNRIQSKLNELGIKQVDAIKITGISKNAFSNYVSGNRIPDNKSLYKLSKFFNVSMEWLLIGVDVPIENLMLYKTMKNKEEFIQIIGRGSRSGTKINEEQDNSLQSTNGNNAINNECQEKLLDYNMFVQSRMIQKDVSEEEGVLIDVYRDLPLDDKEEVKSIICYKHNRITSGLKKKETLSKSGHDEEAAAREFSEMKMA